MSVEPSYRGTKHLGAALKRQLNTQVIVQDRPGAGGIVGTDDVYNDRANGYSLLLGRVATLAVVPAVENVPYNPQKFTYIGLISKDPYTCVTSAKKPYKTLSELKKAIESKPGTITYSSSGTGTLTQIAAVQLLDSLGIKKPRFAAIQIPYKGEGPAIAAVVGGHVDFFCGNLAPMRQAIEAGKLNALLVTTPERVSGLGNIPTAKELGYPKLESVVGWSALVGPPNMAPQARKTLVKAMAAVKNDADWQQKVRTLGSIPDIESPKKTREFVQNQFRSFKQLVNRLGLKVH